MYYAPRERDNVEVRERKRERVASNAAPASGGASERVPAPVALFLFISLRIDKSSIQRRFWCRDVEAPLALASPIKVPDCGGFSSSVMPAKLPERGGSYSSTVAGSDSGG
ncbi:hypothetical protein IGI04_021663 [Brassica rapa subsp. trilocularis]|uniref:Uncharacterized protein n=1 Tax=Brassica rapa subsp. trilocularis TaxID=1813537 RepID=A0ABQ7M041_BRACM|nr:hypothetical protein IGI04_021663 [Brassica rapa subsp. trilocularis]